MWVSHVYHMGVTIVLCGCRMYTTWVSQSYHVCATCALHVCIDLVNIFTLFTLIHSGSRGHSGGKATLLLVLVLSCTQNKAYDNMFWHLFNDNSIIHLLRYLSSWSRVQNSHEILLNFVLNDELLKTLWPYGCSHVFHNKCPRFIAKRGRTSVNKWGVGAYNVCITIILCRCHMCTT